MKDVFKLVLTAIRQTKRFFKNGTEVELRWKPNAWDGLLKQLTSSEKYGKASGLLAMCKQVRDATRASDPREAKKVKKHQEATANSEKHSNPMAKRKVGEVEPSEKPQKPKKRRTKEVAGIS